MLASGLRPESPGGAARGALSAGAGPPRGTRGRGGQAGQPRAVGSADVQHRGLPFGWEDLVGRGCGVRSAWHRPRGQSRPRRAGMRRRKTGSSRVRVADRDEGALLIPGNDPVAGCRRPVMGPMRRDSQRPDPGHRSDGVSPLRRGTRMAPQHLWGRPGPPRAVTRKERHSHSTRSPRGSKVDVRQVASESQLPAGDVGRRTHCDVLRSGACVPLAPFEGRGPQDGDRSRHLSDRIDCPEG